MKYIFVAGAPGSKWSSVIKNIYHSRAVDRSDYRDEWTFRKNLTEYHCGAYFDPGMIHHLPEDFSKLPQAEVESIFDSPFDPACTGIRIIKSHIFSNNIDYLRETFPDCPVITVYRSSEECFDWWVRIGNFEIPYPNYEPYYKDLDTMRQHIETQTQGVLNAWEKYHGVFAKNSDELSDIMGIYPFPDHYHLMDFGEFNATVKVLFDTTQ